MRLVHAHFPINAIVAKDNKSVEIKNFLGGRQIKKIVMQAGCTVRLSVEVKDELIFEGIDKAGVSLGCAQVCQVCKIGTKDERKFLDGIFVSERSVIKARED
jgi:large subunit ribosomal protein L9e